MENQALNCPKCNDTDIGLQTERLKGEQGTLKLYYCRKCGHTEWFFTKNNLIHHTEWASPAEERIAEPYLSKEIEGFFKADPTLEHLEKQYILHLLQKYAGNKSKVARVLNISRSTLREKIAKYEI